MENFNQTTILKGYTPEEQLQSIGEDIKDFSPINYCPNTMISKDQKEIMRCLYEIEFVGLFIYITYSKAI